MTQNVTEEAYIVFRILFLTHFTAFPAGFNVMGRGVET